ncbi:2-octaprenyl-6-methoxyphenyl hydroxylase [Nitrogeniibacter mangrovi]|uniref:2-octaprenyl-6-methoxyphenyl hydroxylase n=1 Tax=Nitrogeniibacter mangrovi TaxID=2016596 RepID=A0A6C1B2D6_9RHOO|nr:FAD-dependent monooxygenase [Nitrogeniibacter mangrovi]QID17149.1 2-octaprenyl-6-methoxyphenyl hydroxylase [Nitrogeniibacter mangrovi]
MTSTDILIVGAGPVGMALALAVHGGPHRVTLVDARERGAARRDPRVLALAHGTRLTLERLGVWGRLPATPIRRIHVSQQGGAGRTVIEEDEYGIDGLGHVIRAGDLAAALDDAVAHAGIAVLDHCEAAPDPGLPGRVRLTRGDTVDTLSCRLVACAEGGMRADDPDIEVRDYDQHAVICMATPAQAHGHTAYERFTPSGPVALLPCGTDFAVVHTAPPERAETLLALDDAAYLATLQQAFGTRLRLVGVSRRERFPLQLRVRRHPVADRIVWLGNAAQTLHPVAGQGFNLALRDVWALGEQLRGADDPGSPAVLAAYLRQRALDRRGTIGFTDSLVRLFSNDIGPLRHLRGLGLLALDLAPPLRHFVAKRMMFGARAWP